MNSSNLRTPAVDRSALPFATRIARGAAALGLGLMLLPSAVHAQTQASDNGLSQPSWTGSGQDPAVARKEAAAALAEGRRECARQAEGRAACLKQVEDDHKAALQRLQGSPAASTPAKTSKPAKPAKPG